MRKVQPAPTWLNQDLYRTTCALCGAPINRKPTSLDMRKRYCSELHRVQAKAHRLAMRRRTKSASQQKLAQIGLGGDGLSKDELLGYAEDLPASAESVDLKVPGED